MIAEKYKIAFVGHVDHGKSTLIGRLLYDTGSLPVDKLADLSNPHHFSDIDFSYVTDHFEEERRQGITMDSAQTYFRSEKRDYTIIDAPGHAEFIMNMITGVSEANAAVLLIDAAHGVQEQTKRHAFLLTLLGIRQLVVAVNKMDLIGYAESIYHSLTEQLHSFLANLSFSCIAFIPVCSITGENIVRRSENMPWYTGSTLLESLDSLSIPPEQNSDYAVMAVQDVYHIREDTIDRRIAVGRVETGIIHIGEKIQVLPSGNWMTIRTIHQYGTYPKVADRGECIGLEFTDPIYVDRESILSTGKGQLKVADHFQASLFWMDNHPAVVHQKLQIKCLTQEGPCTIEQIAVKIDSSNLKIIEKNASILEQYTFGQVIIKTKKPMVFGQIPDLCRFVLLADSTICASGILTGVLPAG